MSEMITSYLADMGVDKHLIVFLLSMMPVGELRASIIFAAVAGVTWWKALLISFIGNVIPIPFVILALRPVLDWVKRLRWIGPVATKFHNKILQKSSKVTKYEKYGLLAFVAIPLPGTGGWTGAAIAALLDMRFKRSFPVIILGIAIAGIITTIVTYFGAEIISFVYGLF